MVWTFHDWYMPLAGLFAGIALGAIARSQRFCTMSALERYWFGNDSAPLRTWVLAGASALIFTQGVVALGIIDVSPSFYVTSAFSPLLAIVGGVAFGYGMALTGTCGFGALVRVGGGNLRSLIVLIVLGFAALAAARGALAPLRITLGHASSIDLRPWGGQAIPDLVSGLTGMNLKWMLTALIGTGLLAWIFRRAQFRRNGPAIATGIGMGAAVSFGWLATSWGRANSFESVQLEAASFVMPVGDLVSYLASYTGHFPDYGVGLVVGVIAGAALVAMRQHDVRWEACDDARELGRHIAGALLMGIGGILAMGCTIGQGISAVSVMAISAPVVVLSIAVGAKMGLAHLFEGSPLRAFYSPRHDPAE